MTIQTFKYTMTWPRYERGGGIEPVPTRQVEFQIDVDVGGLLKDKGLRALGKSRTTKVCNGAIVIRALAIHES